MPLLSVVMPVYNVEKYIAQAIESVLNQPCKDLELIIVDDGSPDKSGQICDEYALKDSRVNVIHKENGGVSVARNTGIDAANGKYIAFLDSDDVWVKNFYDENVYNLLVKREYTAYVFKYCYVYDDLTIYYYPSGRCGNHSELVKIDKFIFHIDSFIVELDHIKSNQIVFVPGCTYGEDLLFESNAIHLKDIIFLDKIMSWYRYNPASVCHSGLTEEQKHFSITRGRIWYTEFYKEKNEALYKMNYACIFGSIYEYLTVSFMDGRSVKYVEKELTDNGFGDYYYDYNKHSIPSNTKERFDNYFKNKQLFRIKWRIRGIVRKILGRK